jgi:3-oxoacyl-[acyl-carrier-protein] synthase II
MPSAIYITGLGSISAIGHDAASVARGYAEGGTRICVERMVGKPTPVARVPAAAQTLLQSFLAQHERYQSLDRSVHLALHAGRQALDQAGWKPGDPSFGVVLGSSRGATGLLERYFTEFFESGASRTPSLVSPTTTLGNISSWVAQDVQSRGPATEISSTCSTSMYAVGHAMAWLRSGMAARFLAGGSEAPLTDFTVAQMRGLRVYSRDTESQYPCQPCAADQGKKNSMVLGEGACVLALQRFTDAELRATPVTPLARVDGMGFCVEPIETNTSLSAQGKALNAAMRGALGPTSPSEVDLVVTHTPGTALGDQSELNALRSVFQDRFPILTSNKWILGHTLGASGTLSIEYALHILRTGQWVEYPYPVAFENRSHPIERILVNSVGFGGNAGSLLLSAVR